VADAPQRVRASANGLTPLHDSAPLGCNGLPTTCTQAALDRYIEYPLVRARAPRSRSPARSTDQYAAGAALAQATQRSSTSVPSACGPVAAPAPALGLFWLWILGLSLAVVGASAVSGAPLPRKHEPRAADVSS
jgi:hypothetical protein